jgi:dihydrofolate reductase
MTTTRDTTAQGRRVIVQELVSADGFTADPAGGLDFFDAVPDYGEVDRDNLALLETVGAVLLGRATYELFAAFWPTAEGEAVADAVNGAPKIVFSSTLDAAPWGPWAPARVLSGDAAAHVDRLRREPGGDLLVWGSISLARSLLDAGLVDELQLRVLPVVLGAGRSLGGTRHDLALLEARAYASGVVGLRYAPRR